MALYRLRSTDLYATAVVVMILAVAYLAGIASSLAFQSGYWNRGAGPDGINGGMFLAWETVFGAGLLLTGLALLAYYWGRASMYNDVLVSRAARPSRTRTSAPPSSAPQGPNS